MEITDLTKKYYATINNVVMPKKFLEYVNEIENFEVFDDDVWVCTFPKCGTTWTQEMIWLLGNKLDYNAAKVTLQKRFPYLEISTIASESEGPEEYKNSVEFSKNLSKPRFIKTHLPWILLPQDIKSGKKRPKIVYTARNPKDTCISYYYHSKLFRLKFFEDIDEIETYCHAFLNDLVPYAPYWDHVLTFWNKKFEENILFLKYEDMKSDLKQIIIKAANFLNVSISDSDIENLKHHLSFESMQKNSAVNFETLVQNRNKMYTGVYNNAKFMRSGKVGDFKNHMSKEVEKIFDLKIKEKTAGTGLYFLKD